MYRPQQALDPQEQGPLPPSKRQRLYGPTSPGTSPGLVVPASAPGRYISKREKRQAVQSVPIATLTTTQTGLSPIETATETGTRTKTGEVPSLQETEETECQLAAGKLEGTTRNRQANSFPKANKISLVGHTGAVNRIAWRPTHGDLLLSCSMDKTVRIWDPFVGGGQVQLLDAHAAAVKDADWNFDGTSIVSGGYDKIAALTDVKTGRCLHHKEWLTSVKFHPTQPHLFVVGGHDCGVVCWDSRTNRVVRNFQAEFGQINSLEFIENGTQLITCSDITKRNALDKAILVFDFDTGAILSNQVYQEGYTCTCIKRHPTTNNFLAQSSAGYIAIFSCKSPYKLNRKRRFQGHNISGFNVGFSASPDGNILGTGSSDGLLYFYSWTSGNLIKKLKGHSKAAMDVEYHPILPSTVASCSWNSEIKIWE